MTIGEPFGFRVVGSFRFKVGPPKAGKNPTETLNHKP